MQGVMFVISDCHLACGLVSYRAGKERLELLSRLSVTINLWRRQMKGMNESEEEREEVGPSIQESVKGFM